MPGSIAAISSTLRARVPSGRITMTVIATSSWPTSPPPWNKTPSIGGWQPLKSKTACPLEWIPCCWAASLPIWCEAASSKKAAATTA